MIAVLPDGSKRRFDDLMTHTKAIVNDSCRIRAFDAFFGVLQECFRDFGDVPPKQEVLDIYGRIIINSFNIMNTDFQSVGVGLYLEASALDHSCRPNVAPVFDGKRIVVRCIKEEGLRAFSDAKISYCCILHPRERRRKDLREQYYFECRCEECEDEDSPLEAKKEGCLRCRSCSRGVPMNRSAIREAEVTCESCRSVVPADQVHQYWTTRDAVVDAILINDCKHPEPMEQSGDLVMRMEGLFHPADTMYIDLLEHCYEEALEKVCARMDVVKIPTIHGTRFHFFKRKTGIAPWNSGARSW